MNVVMLVHNPLTRLPGRKQKGGDHGRIAGHMYRQLIAMRQGEAG